METSWRELLGKMIRDPHEQQRLLEVLNVSSMTLRRWVNGETNPRPQNLRSLLSAIPQQRKQMISLLVTEFPFIAESSDLNDEDFLMSAEFYAQVINTYVSVSQYLRPVTISNLLLQHMLTHIDPYRDGLLIYIAQCVPPAQGQKVRSVRIVMGRGTAPWSTYVEHHPLFMGMESMVGYAITSGHLTVIRNRVEGLHSFASDQVDNVESAVAIPIVLANQTAGGVYLASTQSDHFTQKHLALIQKYIELMCLGFEKEDFYLLSDIALDIMPTRDQQLPFLVTFQQRVTQQMVSAAHEKHILTRPQAERIVWQQLEEELLQISVK